MNKQTQKISTKGIFYNNNTKGHLKGWQWRESKKALEKKNKAKTKHFKTKENKDFEIIKKDFIIQEEGLKEVNFGIVSELSRGRIKVLFENMYYDCTIQQGLPFELSKVLAVGDHVIIENKDNNYFVNHLVERKTTLARLKKDSTRWGGGSVETEQIIATNVDVAIIVVAAKNPPLHPRFIDRYLVLIKHSNIQPIICVNKSDLGIENEKILSAYRNLGIQTIETSVESGQGINELKEIIRNKVVVLVGNSGVGKSSLINAISLQSALKVGEVSQKSGKGKHTTTSSGLISWDNNSFIIDTPGIRSLEMMNLSKQELPLYFDEFLQYLNNCKFSDCIHDAEEDCGVKIAVKNGLIDQQRYESYLKILYEIG